MVHFGIENCHYCLRNSAPVKMPGAVSLSKESGADLVTKKIRLASGIIIEKPVAVTQNAAKVSLEIASLPLPFLTDILGYEIDSSGVLIEYQQLKAVPFTLLFETQADTGNIRMQYCECYCPKPSFTVTTVGENVTISTRKLELISTGSPISKSITAKQNQTVYDNWFGGVY